MHVERSKTQTLKLMFVGIGTIFSTKMLSRLERTQIKIILSVVTIGQFVNCHQIKEAGRMTLNLHVKGSLH